MKKWLITASTALLFFGCTTEDKMKDQMAKILSENPKILADAIEKNPAVIMMSLQKAARAAQEEMGKQREVEEKKKLEEAFDKPLVAEIRSDEAIRGAKDAPITLIEYSEFQCPWCKKGFFDTVQPLLEKYSGKIRFIFKHNPPEPNPQFHPQSYMASQYYEAIRLQDVNKAFKFHDEIFSAQDKVGLGAPFFDAIAKKVGANIATLKKDLNSPQVKNRIEQDRKESNTLGFQGTPGFLINGVPFRGFVPAEQISLVIDELVKKGKLKL